MILEVFCCSGGMAEGLRRAGLQPDLAFDRDDDACNSYAANLGHRPIQLDARDLLRMVKEGWSPGTVDLFVADPPCTPWSRAGKRQGQADDRDMLAVTVEIIAILHPRFWLLANVPGLDDGPNWPIVQREIGGLSKAAGYCIDFARLDAADYGVPQHRIRPFWFGHSRGFSCIEWPERTHAAPDACGATLPGITAPRKPWVTCRQALSHLSPADMGSPVRLRWRQQTKTGKGPRATHLDEVAHVVTTKDTGGDGNIVFDGPNHRPSRLLEWPWDRPCTTVHSDPNGRIAPPGEHKQSRLSGPNAIKLSEKAAAILQGFPPGWVFSGKTKVSRWSQLGQAMPPPLAEAVARSMWRAMHPATRKAAP